MSDIIPWNLSAFPVEAEWSVPVSDVSVFQNQWLMLSRTKDVAERRIGEA